MSASLDDFLAVTRAAGLVESEGEFSVDLGKALESLQQFTLQQPRTYFRYLVASAVARGATYVKLETSRSSLLIRDDGRPLSFQELKTTFPSMMVRQSKDNAAQRLLGIGLCGARGLGFSSAEVHSSRAVLRFVKGRLEVSDEPGEPESFVRITERRSLGKALSHFLRKDGWEHLRDGSRCLRLARAHITIDGEPVAELHKCQEGPVWKIGQDLQEPSPSFDILGASETELPYFGYLETQFDGGIPLSFVVHGIAFEEQNPRQGFGGAIYCDELKLDASFLGLVKDKRLLGIQEELGEFADQALITLLQQVRESPGPKVQLLRRVALADQPRDWLERLLDVPITARDGEALTFAQVREQVRTLGFLKVEESLGDFESVLRYFFPSLIEWNQVTLPSARELLSQPSPVVLKFPLLPIVLRWEPTAPERPFECRDFAEKNAPLSLDGPRGLQLLALQPEVPLQQGLPDFDKRVVQVGSLAFRYLKLGLLEPAQASSLFLSLVEWGLKGQRLYRPDINAMMNALHFATEGGKLVDFPTLREAGAVVYTLESDKPSGSTDALRLSHREYDVLFDSGILSLYHAFESEDSGAWRPV